MLNHTGPGLELKVDAKQRKAVFPKVAVDPHLTEGTQAQRAKEDSTYWETKWLWGTRADKTGQRRVR